MTSAGDECASCADIDGLSKLEELPAGGINPPEKDGNLQTYAW